MTQTKWIMALQNESQRMNEWMSDYIIGLLEEEQREALEMSFSRASFCSTENCFLEKK